MEKLFAIFTDSKGNPELASIAGIIAFIAFIFFSYHSYVILKAAFDPMGFGTGAGGLAAGVGVGKVMGNKGDYGSGQ
jgi:hypothetical protein